MKKIMKKVKKSELKPGLQVVLNNLPDATLYTVKEVLDNGLTALLTYVDGTGEANGGVMDYSLMYHPSAEQKAFGSVTYVPIVFDVPALDIDKLLYKERNGIPHARGKLERRIVYNLLRHLYANGFALHDVDDGEEETHFIDVPQDEAIKQAMELVFNLDEVRLYFSVAAMGDNKPRYMIYLVLGNGIDCICDYSAPVADVDKWNATLDAFDAEKYE